MTTTDGLRARHGGRSTPAARSACRSGRPRSGRVFNVLGQPIDDKGPVDAETYYPIHRHAPPLRGADDRHRGLRDGHQGHRPDRALRQGRQGRRVRRRRRRQDGHHPGADPQRRRRSTAATPCSPAWASAPARATTSPRDDRVGRHRQDGDGLRPDERAARRAPARRPDRPHDGRVLPRRGPRRPALHRQHLPLHAGGLGGLGAARPHAVGGGLPAEPGHRDGAASRSASPRPRRARSPRCRPIFVPADDYTDPAPATAFGHLDSTIRLERYLTELGIYPAVDPLTSTSRVLDPLIVGQEHYDVAREVQRVLQRYRDLQDIIAILGIDELSEDDKATRRPGPPAAALHEPAVLRGRGLHRPRRASTSRSRTPCALQGDPRGQGRRPARAGLLPGGHDRRRPRERAKQAGAPERAAPRWRSSRPSAWPTRTT